MDDSMIKISGSIGMIILQNSNKKVFIFHDDHSNKKYCTDGNLFLYDLLENIKNKNKDTAIFLEEPFVDKYSNIKFLWNDTPHVIKFRKFYKKIMKKCADTRECYTFPVDIRLCLCDISLDELYSNITNLEYFKNYNPIVKEYFKYLLYLFDIENISKKSFNESESNIIFIKKVFDTFTNTKYFIKLKEQFIIFYNKFIKSNINNTITNFINKYPNPIYIFKKGYPFENNNLDNFQDQYDKLINGIMEYYACILIFGLGYTNNFIYSGYYHGNNIAYILEKYYNFKPIYSTGQTDNIELVDDNYISNCLLIDKKNFNI